MGNKLCNSDNKSPTHLKHQAILLNTNDQIQSSSTNTTTQISLQKQVPPQQEETIEEHLISKQDIRHFYQFNPKIIGQGYFGTVRTATLLSNPQKICAVKSLSKEKLQKMNKLEMCYNEIKIIKKIDHPNIVKFYEAFEDNKYLHLVMEFCAGGELFDQIVEEGFMSEQRAAWILRQIMSATTYLHQLGICHRDLKPENFMFASTDASSAIKLLDFGLSQYFQLQEETIMLKSIAGSSLYMAPEVIQGKGYNEKCDLWSIGVLMFILLSGQTPFDGDNDEQIFQNVIQAKYSLDTPQWKHVSLEAKELIQHLLDKNSQTRFTSEEALNHPWIKMNSGTNSVSCNLRLIDKQIINTLKNFRGLNKFKKEVMRVIINQLKEEEIDNLRKEFLKFDLDGTGKISYQELKQIMEKIDEKSDENELKKIINSVTIGEHQDIYYMDFIAATIDKKVYLSEENLWSAFRYFDVDNTNNITIQNLKEAMLRGGKEMDDEQIKKMLLDNNINVEQNSIEFEEFKKIMKTEIEF